ncbi:MAG: type III-B CRISPR module RAMP protein Cmr6 [Chloroflexi bacterium]|nr:type III-B CRISPR module RAMP protein Cmr6 [Chloroflexota bacterium]
MADIPVPADTARAYRAGGRQCRNFGLLFDRFVPYGPGWVMEGSQKSDAAQKLVNEINGWRDSAYKQMFEAIRARHTQTIRLQNGRSFTAHPEWRLAIGLGYDSAFETGLTLHRTYGCPYIPGSALKGMTLAWVKAIKEQENITDEEITTVFGSDDTDNPQSGSIIFYDALPITPPALEIDMMNPHYPDYYRPNKAAYPTDWQDPVPVYFITVAAQMQFLFGVGARRGHDDLVGKAEGWLKDALENAGVGGKTTSGYGYWHVK